MECSLVTIAGDVTRVRAVVARHGATVLFPVPPSRARSCAAEVR